MKKEFVMRGQTASGQQEVLNFSGHKKGYAYILVEFQLYPSTDIGTTAYEMMATVTAAKSSMDPVAPDFADEGLIATTFITASGLTTTPAMQGITVVNDTFLITQDLILQVFDTQSAPVNWQCRFVSEKMNLSQEAVANYNQFSIFDG